jgi:hypothetical protein
MNSSLVLYSTSACHLCEQALALLQPWLERGVCAREVDISESDALMQRYGLTIPVLAREAGGPELNWPFDAQELKAWLEQTGRD